MAARDDSLPEGPDEATLVRLKDGRLYCAMRTGTHLYQMWSPILLGAGTGTDVMQRIAAPLVGGLVTSTLLTLR